MNQLRRPRCFRAIATLLAALILPAASPPAWGANHREAPITALDHKADIADFFAFVSYDNPDRVTFILDVDPLLEPSNGPNYFPFDPEVLYAIRIDNNNDAVEDLVIEVRFQTSIRQPEVFTGFVGSINIPGVGTIPPITALRGPGSEGVNLRQRYTVTVKRRTRNGSLVPIFTANKDADGNNLIAVPSNVGPKTMPNYPALAAQGIHTLSNGMRVFAGTAYDPFYIDLGAAFDTLNFRLAAGGGVLSAADDADDNRNTAPDDVAGFNVNVIAVEMPIGMLTRVGAKVAADHPAATIGAWGTTSRPSIKLLSTQPGGPPQLSPFFTQIQRMGNPLINELIIGTGDKDKFSMSEPQGDAQFANYVLDPLLARVFAGLGLPLPPTPRTDLLFLAQYDAHANPVGAIGRFHAPGVGAGPVADLLRLNTGVPPTPKAQRKRLGLLAGDAAGFPNGRRVSDDVTDVAARAVGGILLGAPFNSRIGDGVNTKGVPYQEVFPYVAFAVSGKNSRHVDPGEAGCGAVPPGTGICPVDSPVGP